MLYALHQGFYEDQRVRVTRLKQTKKIALDDFDDLSLETLYRLRTLSADRLNSFIGMTFNEMNQFVIVWKFDVRSTLHDIIFNDDINVNDQFQASFISDIVKV